MMVSSVMDATGGSSLIFTVSCLVVMTVVVWA
jgi:hypothetical protein